MKRWTIRLAGLALLLTVAGCLMGDFGSSRFRPPADVAPRRYRLEITGYCPCGSCCSWHRNWLFQPVISSGPNRGKSKKVGYTASGTKAQPGTIAADTSIFPFGTLMYVPGYGYGRVEDRGGDIKGFRLDLFFESHEDAKIWGRKREVVQVWLPSERGRRR